MDVIVAVVWGVWWVMVSVSSVVVVVSVCGCGGKCGWVGG